MSLHQFEVALQINLAPSSIFDLVQSVDSKTDVLHDLFAYGLNEHHLDLERFVVSKTPDLFDDIDLCQQVWIYCQIYDRPDLESRVTKLLPELPWNLLLPVAIIEDVESAINESFNHGHFSVDDFIISLVAAHRMGNQEIIDELEILVGPDLALLVEKGYAFEDPPDASISYRVLFQQRPVLDV